MRILIEVVTPGNTEWQRGVALALLDAIAPRISDGELFGTGALDSAGAVWLVTNHGTYTDSTIAAYRTASSG